MITWWHGNDRFLHLALCVPLVHSPHPMRKFDVFIYVSMSKLWRKSRVSGDSMMTSSNGNIFRVTGHLCGKFTGPRWISRTKASDAELWCFLWFSLNIRLSKQPRGWWFETPAWSLWRHRNAIRHDPHVALLSWSEMVFTSAWNLFSANFLFLTFIWDWQWGT